MSRSFRTIKWKISKSSRKLRFRHPKCVVLFVISPPSAKYVVKTTPLNCCPPSCVFHHFYVIVVEAHHLCLNQFWKWCLTTQYVSWLFVELSHFYLTSITVIGLLTSHFTRSWFWQNWRSYMTSSKTDRKHSLLDHRPVHDRAHGSFYATERSIGQAFSSNLGF